MEYKEKGNGSDDDDDDDQGAREHVLLCHSRELRTQ